MSFLAWKIRIMINCWISTDMSDIPIKARTSGIGYKVYGWKNVYTLTNDKAASLLPPQSSYRPNSAGNEIYNQEYAYPNGLNNLGAPHRFILNPLFWLWR